MFLPVSSVNSSTTPTPAAVSFTSADAWLLTSIVVLTSNPAPPQVPANPVCNGEIVIDGFEEVAAGGVSLGVADAVPASSAKHSAAQNRANSPQQNPSAAMRKCKAPWRRGLPQEPTDSSIAAGRFDGPAAGADNTAYRHRCGIDTTPTVAIARQISRSSAILGRFSRAMLDRAPNGQADCGW